jgi:hypothetical protein
LGGVVLGRVAAYNDDGHFHTAVSIAHTRLPAFKDKGREAAVLMTLRTQIPDLAWEFDAVSLRVLVMKSASGWLWGGFTACRSDAVCHMVTAWSDGVSSPR